MTTSPLARHFARCLAHNLLTTLTLGTLLAFGMATQEKQGFEPAPTIGSPAWELEQRGNDCWTEPAGHPADLIGADPRTVIVSGGASSDPDVIKAVVEQAYFGINHNLRIYGFCR